jgi:hypothetical protein
MLNRAWFDNLETKPSTMSKRHNDSGQALVLVALGMVVLLGFMGLGLDFGYLRYVKRQVQMAADAAAIAGAKAIQSCKGTLGCSALTTAGETAVSTDNGFKNVSLSTSCNPAPALGNTLVVVNNPPSCGGSNDPNYHNSYFVEAIVSQQVPTFFAKFIGASSATVTARAEVQGFSNCIYGLETGSGDYALTMGFFNLITSSCGAVSNSGINTGLAGGLCAPAIDMVGSVSGAFGLCTGGKTTLPSPPTKISTAVEDPLASVPEPSVISNCIGSSAGVSTITGTGSLITVGAGDYCGGIKIVSGGAGKQAIVEFQSGFETVIGGGTNAIKPGLQIAAGSNVSFQPSTYQIDGGISDAGSTINFNTACASITCATPNLFVLDGGGLSLGGGGGGATTATGYGVTFFNSGTGSGSCTTCYGAITDNFATTTHLSAPTTGNYAGILFFQDRNNPQAATFEANFSFGSGTAATDGGFYFPDAQVNFDFNFGNAAEYTWVIANVVNWGVANFTFNNNYASLPGGVSPLPVGQAALIE